LNAITPKRTVGKMFQGDMLWMTPEDLQVSDDKVVFKPNKIPYEFELQQPIGAKIKRSQAGIVIHGVYDSADAAADAFAEPTPTTPEQHKITGNSKLIVFGAETKLDDTVKLKKPKAEIESLRNLLASAPAQKIDDMLDPFNIGALKISNLADLFKTYITARAGKGVAGLDDAAEGFVKWVQSPASKVTGNKQKNVLAHIKQYQRAYAAMWQIVAGLTDLKHQLKDQFDQQAGGEQGQVQPTNGHEGFVAVTPHGRIKLVNRPVFMKKA